MYTYKNILILFTLTLLICFASHSSLAKEETHNLPDLSELETMIGEGPEVLAAEMILARDTAWYNVQSQRAGAKYFLGLNYGYNNEPATATSMDHDKYKQLNVSGGITLPLLGTKQKGDIGKYEAEIKQIRSQYNVDLLRLNNLVALRKAYTLVWTAQQKIEFCQRFLATEQETDEILMNRQEQGLILPADRMQLMAVYADVRSDLAYSEWLLERGMNVIRLVTNKQWNAGVSLLCPTLPVSIKPVFAITNHPVYIMNKKLINKYEEIVSHSRHIEREADLTIGATGSKDYPGSDGKGVYLAFTMKEPIKRVLAKDNYTFDAFTKDVEQAKQALQVDIMRLEGDFSQIRAQKKYLATNVRAKEAHVMVEAEGIRENTLKRMMLPGDTFEKIQYIKNQYYRTVMEMLDEEAALIQAEVDLLSYIYPGGTKEEPYARTCPSEVNDKVRARLLSPEWLGGNLSESMFGTLDFEQQTRFSETAKQQQKLQSAIPNNEEKGKPEPVKNVETPAFADTVYVWDARPFLDKSLRNEEFRALKSYGFKSVLLSLNSQEIKSITNGELKSELIGLLEAAKEHDISIQLLLGDPSWCESAGRKGLVKLIRQFKGYKFAGIHLDIEPDQLPESEGRRQELIKGLFETVRAVRGVSELPVSLSIHPRYSEGELREIVDKELTKGLVKEITIMLYSTNTEIITDRIREMRLNQDICEFALAQSVELALDATQSYAKSGLKDFAAAMAIIKANAEEMGIRHVVVQSWEDFRKGMN